MIELISFAIYDNYKRHRFYKINSSDGWESLKPDPSESLLFHPPIWRFFCYLQQYSGQISLFLSHLGKIFLSLFVDIRRSWPDLTRSRHIFSLYHKLNEPDTWPPFNEAQLDIPSRLKKGSFLPRSVWVEFGLGINPTQTNSWTPLNSMTSSWKKTKVMAREDKLARESKGGNNCFFFEDDDEHRRRRRQWFILWRRQIFL